MCRIIYVAILIVFVTQPVRAIIRLSKGSYGRIEVYYSGSWGTVCDDSWDIEDGNVACRELGYAGATSVYQGAAYGRGTGKNLDGERWMYRVRGMASSVKLFVNCLLLPLDDAKAILSVYQTAFSSAHVSRGVETLRECKTVEREASTRLTLGQSITDSLD